MDEWMNGRLGQGQHHGVRSAEFGGWVQLNFEMTSRAMSSMDRRTLW